MKRLTVVAMLVLALVVVFSSVTWAQGPGPGPRPGATGTPPTPPCDTPPCGGRGPGMRQGAGMPSWAGIPEEVEQLLGMTADEIRAERQAGKSLVEIAAAKNVSKETLVTTILNAHRADLDQLVAEGKLTQAQADTMYQRMQTMVPVMVEQTEVGPRHGPGQGRPGPRGTPAPGAQPGPRWGNR